MSDLSSEEAAVLRAVANHNFPSATIVALAFEAVGALREKGLVEGNIWAEDHRGGEPLSLKVTEDGLAALGDSLLGVPPGSDQELRLLARATYEGYGGSLAALGASRARRGTVAREARRLHRASQSNHRRETT